MLFFSVLYNFVKWVRVSSHNATTDNPSLISSHLEYLTYREKWTNLFFYFKTNSVYKDV